MRRHGTWLLLVFVGTIGAAAFAVRAASEAKEEKVSIDQVPAAVKAAILSEGGQIEDIARETSEGKTIYEADVIKDGKQIELRVAEDGKLITRKVEGDAKQKEGKEEKEGETGGEDSEEQAEAEACVEGAKALAAAKVTMLQAIETAEKEGKGAKPFKADLELDEGKLLFDVELLAGANGPEMEIDAISGKVVKIESVEEQEKEDAAEGNKQSEEEQQEEKEKAEAAKVLPIAKVTLAKAVEIAMQETHSKAFKAEFKPENGQPRYEIQVAGADKCSEVVVDGVTGKVLETEIKGNTQPAKASAQEEGWRTAFPVDKANLVPTGKNPHFILEPGRKSVFKDEEGTKLTITVLAETKVVDGVTTRIVEEREEKNGQPEEISRNYFAMDKTTGDVYYFGEEVDEYKNGKVASHGGAWLSGVEGARFGLMMPAKAKVGDKFYQEVAPKVAMDRAEIVSVDEELKTPAGTFKCVHVKETSPLEKGASHKWHAAGVGLVKDDEFVLAEKPQ